MSTGISAIILNWQRPANVARIVAGWRTAGLANDAIIWNNNPETPLAKVAGAKVINASEDMGLYTRFAAACLARHDCLLIQDDDLILTADSLRRLHGEWMADPDIIHGVFGRVPKDDGSYAHSVVGDVEVPIVLTRFLFVHRKYAARFFDVAPSFEELQRDTHPFGNGEDILLNYVVRKSSGRLNRIHRADVQELPSPHAIHVRDKKAHYAHRTRLLRACEAWLKSKC